MNDGKRNTETAASTAPAGAQPSPVSDTEGRSGVAARPSTSAAKEIGVGTKFYQVQFRVHVSMRYHQARRSWWTNLNRLSTAAAALAGSAALIAVFGEAYRVQWAWVSAGSGAIAALNSALGFSDRAREHGDLYRAFSIVAAKMAAADAADDATGRAFEAEVLQLEASEPPSIHTLNVICHNQECEARGLPQESRCKIYFVNRIFKSWGTVIDRFPSMPPAAE